VCPIVAASLIGQSASMQGLGNSLLAQAEKDGLARTYAPVTAPPGLRISQQGGVWGVNNAPCACFLVSLASRWLRLDHARHD
jgi:hypothetical protein